MELLPLQLYLPGDSVNTSIQSAVNAAAKNPKGAVWIPPNYKGTDSYTNPSSVPVFDLRGSGSLSFGAGGQQLGALNIWTALQTFTRTAETGTALQATNFSLAGWGAASTISALAGYDGAHVFTVTAGTSPSASPTIQLTYADGTWTNVPIVIGIQSGGTGQVSDFKIVSGTGTYTLTYNGLPVAGKTYIVTVMVRGLA